MLGLGLAGCFLHEGSLIAQVGLCSTGAHSAEEPNLTMEGPIAPRKEIINSGRPTKRLQNQERRNGEWRLNEGGGSKPPPDPTKKTLAKDQSVPE